MKLAKYVLPSGDQGIGRIEIADDALWPLDLSRQYRTLFEILESDNPHETAEFLTRAEKKLPLAAVELLPPIDQQEVWAAGVTYKRSRTARMEESTSAASCYDLVYASPRPELFFKASPHRVSGHGQPLRIRVDSDWNVPEPELALVISPRLKLVGFTIGNDMSSRDIEGENPLYLPQAKFYDHSCALGPVVTLVDAMPPPDQAAIRLQIDRAGKTVFDGNTKVSTMKRGFDELIEWLGKETSFPHGAVLLTGTGIVPPDDFTLAVGDVVHIDITGIGRLTNRVEHRA